MSQKLLNTAVAAALLLALTACGGNGNTRRLDYKGAVTSTKSLEVPPDLTLPQQGGGDMQLPLLSAQRDGKGAGSVLPQQSNVHVAGSGSQRWLVVDIAPDELWPKLKQFWPTLGLEVARDEARLGIMETNWAENRADIKGGFVSGFLGKLSKSLHSASTRDKYRLRLERGDNNKSELYVTHYGVEHVVKSTDSEGFHDTMWQVRPSDSELANEVLKELMAYLGTPQEAVKALAVSEPVDSSVRLTDDGGPALRLDEGFDRAWRRTGIALDRMGLVVEDRDRSSGLYYVTKVALLDEEQKGGWFSGKKQKPVDPHYRIKLDVQGESVRITVLDGAGTRLVSESARTLLERMRGQMQ